MFVTPSAQLRVRPLTALCPVMSLTPDHSQAGMKTVQSPGVTCVQCSVHCSVHCTPAPQLRKTSHARRRVMMKELLTPFHCLITAGNLSNI